MKQAFNRVILYARQHRANQGVSESLHRLVEFLAKKNVETVQDKDTSSTFNLELPILERCRMGSTKDLIVVVGGDGSLLAAARMAIQTNTPVIGINRGRLGFLTDISPQELETQLSAVLAGKYKEEPRFLLHTSVYTNQHLDFECNSLNDVILSRGNDIQLIEFDVYVDKQLMSHFRSDGMILSTPTGSTAYALSAGGPIMHPQLNAIALVPMFSHSLNSRPLVINGESEIELHIKECKEQEVRISCDGNGSKAVRSGQKITIKKNNKQLRLLHPLEYHYYDTLRYKLGWESKHQG